MLVRTRYKSCSALYTVQRIKQILNDVGISVKEQFYSVNGADSCRVIIVNDELESFDIGANGKGMNKSYALASAYGELMERIENKALYRDAIKNASIKYPGIKRTRFVYFPDETINKLTVLDINNSLKPVYFPNYNAIINLPEGQVFRSIFAPFEELCSDKNCSVMIPIEYYRAICGSTGMCAGNSREEAIVQGLNEIVERYVLQTLYVHPIPLPNIPLDVLYGTDIYSKLSDLQNIYTVEIKDCSLGRGFPVAGLLLHDSSGNISFRLGADFSLITAVERCFTETFQGLSSIKNSFVNYHHCAPVSIRDYENNLKNGSGRYPNTIFHASYEPFSFPNKDFCNYNEELQYYIDFLKSNGYKVYVKDNSFLSFPAFTVIVPGLSDLYAQFYDFGSIACRCEREFNEVDPYLHLLDYPLDQIRNLIETDDKQYGMKWNTQNPFSRTPLIQFFLFIVLKEYSRAAEILDGFIMKYYKSNTPDALVCFQELIKMRILGKDNDFSELIHRFGETLVNECLKAFSQKASSLSSYLSTCFNCSLCKMRNSCKFLQLVAFESRIQEHQYLYYGK